ncbi:MAG: 2Fe-2S iron-sulfur cluster binding domain-containing protein [Polyangiaceae bacterium]|nr:2Fe-2S iron-sulfur cluster binding domain-containing protein [Polyangiaceae bacterium]
MPRVRFIEQAIEVDVELGTTILQASKRGGAPEGDACGGVCACSTCHVYVEEGADLLSEPSDEEEDILDKAFDVRMHSRLGCQARIERDGLVAVRITKESLDAFYNEHPDVKRPER